MENHIVSENPIVSDGSLQDNADMPITIEFVDVSFSYDKKHFILEGFNLKINAHAPDNTTPLLLNSLE